jgi:LmbE family N-acetylglucosaminyl deacetylase
MTQTTATKRCLVLAPHPDDETLGCAVTIMRKVERGTAVRIVIATDGRHSSHSQQLSADQIAAMRYAECIDACGRLGVAQPDVIWLAFEDARLASVQSALAEKLRLVAEDFRPDEVLTTSVGDPHVDHAALGRAARAVFADRSDVDLYEYPIWQWRQVTSWLDTSDAPVVGRRCGRAAKAFRFLRNTPFLVSSRGYLARKHNALDAYVSQLHNVTGEADWWYLDKRFLINFFRGAEVFFRVK